MSLIIYDLFGEKRDKVQHAIDLVRSFEPPDKYYLAYSGGKDSIVVEAILCMAGVGYEIHYNMTTVDPPELVRFVIRQFEAVIYDRRWSSSNLRFDLDHPRPWRGQLCQGQSCLADGSFKYFAVNSGGRLLSPATAQSIAGKRCIHFTIPKLSMRQLIVHKQFPPTRLARYCCEALKESHGEGRVVVTGVRWDESAGRKRDQGMVTIFNGKAAEVAEQQGARYNNNRARGIIMNYDDAATRRVVEMCYRTHKTMLNPIIDWTDEDVWEFIHAYNIPYCELYDTGCTRLGCVGCPMGGYAAQRRELARWPQYRKLYVSAFDDMLEARRRDGKLNHSSLWQSGEGVMQWWTGYERKMNPKQIALPLVVNN